MKTQISNTLQVLKRFRILAFAALAFVAVSCEEDNTELMGRPNNTGNAAANNPGESRRAPAIGDDPIATIAIEAGFSELVEALGFVDTELNTGLVDLFANGTGQYTVFAPTNIAFDNLYNALGIEDITELPAELVRDVLFYHVTEGRRAANSVVPVNGKRNINTLLGVSFSVDNKGMITAVGNTANIVASNISASNGIIHVIDAVILPIE